MRDTFGRYRNPKPIEDSAPEWAHGCGRCELGIVSSPPLTRAVDLHLERLVQAIDKQLTFCDCMAGKRYEVALRNLRQSLIEEARRSPLMQQSAHRLSHPDIEIARQRIEAAQMTMPAPTVHYEVTA